MAPMHARGIRPETPPAGASTEPRYERGRTTTYNQCCGQRIGNLSLGWVEMQHGGEAKDEKKLPRSGLVQRCASGAANSRSDVGAEAIGGRFPGKGTGYPAPSPQTRTCAINASGSSVASSVRQWLTKQATPRVAHHFADPVQFSGVSWIRLVSPASLP